MKKFTFVNAFLLGSILILCKPGYSQGEGNPTKPAEKVDPTAKTRVIMSQIFSNLTHVLPLSMSMEEFGKQENRVAVLNDLKQMSDSSDALIDHAKNLESSFGFIARSMSRDLKDIYSWYQKGSSNEARYLLHQISENCVSCHMKLPDPGHAPKMDHFFKNVAIAKLAPPERAKLQVALRQFDDALNTWEDTFSASTKPGEIYAMDSLTEYLKVAIRVKADPKRALKTLDDLTKRNDVPKFMLREVNTWKKSLKTLTPEITKNGSELVRAEKIMKNARQNMDYPMDRSSLIDYIVASTLLNKALKDPKITPVQKSQAYYLLGVTESLIGRSAWLTQTDYYYEASIRSAPKSKFAPLAYDALEQQITMEYSGSGGISIPEDVDNHLKELRTLVMKK